MHLQIRLTVFVWEGVCICIYRRVYVYSVDVLIPQGFAPQVSTERAIGCVESLCVGTYEEFTGARCPRRNQSSFLILSQRKLCNLQLPLD